MRGLLPIGLLIFVTSAGADLNALRAEANAAAAAGDHATAIARFQDLLQESPDDGGAHYRLATLLMDNDGDLDLAMAHFEQARDLSFQPLGAGYRLSRIHARQGRTEEALSELESIAAAGFGLPNLIEGQADYASINGDPRFIAALEQIQAARYPCQADERHHAFDFWIGEWEVTQNGQFAGTNKIQPILGHCAIFEQWTGANGGEGKSFNYYDPGYDRWRQIWISDSGSFIEFTGEARDGGVFYTAETIDPTDGSRTDHKFQFTRNDDGTVRQFWQTSTDGGTTWNTIWDGRYERMTEE
ncbi:MAG: tetratricopeptide repeat protein [Xanthomonadales bacterium]|nr:tetratricopeptide repeat protein [Xanthomonadales bacterium]